LFFLKKMSLYLKRHGLFLYKKTDS